MENERLEERLGFWAGLRQGYAEEMAQLRGVSIERKYVEYNSLGRVGRFVGGDVAVYFSPIINPYKTIRALIKELR
ncbi:MAG TPA: hypothetical protein HA282_05325 [Nanoarchaeota archaeon]|nr:MAG: hypothetical protein QT01_C0001G0164 [archaeon GW2011_AR6]HIH17590.1 hypothetical protein [Nanoarchaeota archaeon]HIH33883.1 hypothetical protein [Nanoarchaeota archaeon]HIH51087.1 hypothetical protein [Nanoarchaeota archaeon]HIH66603.1 hypothetical protein [Nanoarchaeota archaeon]